MGVENFVSQDNLRLSLLSLDLEMGRIISPDTTMGGPCQRSEYTRTQREELFERFYHRLIISKKYLSLIYLHNKIY